MPTDKRDLHRIALRLGMLAADVEQRMSVDEYEGWLIFFAREKS